MIQLRWQDVQYFESFYSEVMLNFMGKLGPYSNALMLNQGFRCFTEDVRVDQCLGQIFAMDGYPSLGRECGTLCLLYMGHDSVITWYNIS